MSCARRSRSLAAVLLVAAAANAQSRVAFFEVEARGPFSGAALDAGAAGETVLDGALAAGEVRRLVVPVPRASAGPAPEPAVRDGAADVRVLGARERDARFDALPAALRARPLPAAPEDRVRASPALLALLAAAFVVGIAARGRAALALVAALAFAGVACALGARPQRGDANACEVLDGVAGTEAWLRVRAAQGALDLPARSPAFELRSEPARARLRVVAPLDPGRAFRVEAPGARLFAAWIEPWPDDVLEPARNGLVGLAEAWVREEGTWTARGAWPLGAALPEARAGADPPGWLVSGLPQGVRVVVGREEAPGAPRWVRCVWR